MDEFQIKETFDELFNRHIGIARNIFGEHLLQYEEAAELAVFATKMAILKWDTTKGSLSTLVHYLALYYKKQYNRSFRQYYGLDVEDRRKRKTKRKFRGRYTTPHKQIQISEIISLDGVDRCELKTKRDNPVLIACDASIDIEIQLDVWLAIEQLEQDNPDFYGNKRLSNIIKGILAKKTETEIAEELEISRCLVSAIRKKARKALREKLENLLQKD